jgi:hypothetical protein
MASFDIEDIAGVGSVRDTPAYMLPPEVWTLALNMRAIDGGLEALLGWEQVFGTPGVAPHFAMPLNTPSQTIWLYAGLQKIYAYDGTTHANITRQTALVDVNYAAGDSQDWNGTLLGGVPILNNGTDVPQYWSPQTVGTKMQDLPNWQPVQPALRAKVMRAFGPYLVAFNLVGGANAFPHTVHWSHPTDPGTVPSGPLAWDYSNTASDSGRTDLPDVNSGVIVDALPLGGVMYIYKESSLWKMRFIGGRFIFDFGQSAWLPTIGLLARRCMVATSDGQRHVFASQDDILWHDGNSVDSILNRRQRRRLFNEIDTVNFGTSFMFDNPYYKEAWFCYPGSGQVYPDRALIMNYSDPKKWVVTEADGITFRHATSGKIETPNFEIWDTGTDNWDDDTGPWSELQRRRVVLSAPASTKFFNLDKGVSRDGVTFATTLQRTGLALVGKKRDGSPIVDFQQMKMLHRIWPKIVGGPVNVRFGTQDYVEGPITWGSAVSFNPTLHAGHGVPGPVSGRAVGLEYATTGSVSWRLDGYKLEMEALGDF